MVDTRISGTEHDLYWSKLKPLVDRTSLSSIVGGSCSGEHPHRTAAIQVVPDRSIQEHGKRMLAGTKDASQPGPTTQHRSSEALAPQLPAPAPQPPSQSVSNPVVVSASVNIEAPQGPSTFSDTGKKFKGVRCKGPAANGTTNSSLTHAMELVCGNCSTTIPLAHYNSRPFASCRRGMFHTTECSGCGTERVGKVDVCANCQGKFRENVADRWLVLWLQSE